MNFYRNKAQNMNKSLCCLALMALTTFGASAQSGTNSPYSQFGLGDLAGQSVGFNKGMGGVGFGFRKGNEVNPMNPASYSSIDSLTFIFDAGLSGQMTKYREYQEKVTAKSGGFDYVVGSFRVVKNLGMSFGIMPYSNIGFNYYTKERLYDVDATIKTTHSGSGGLNQAFVGLGWQIIKPLSVGFNIAYLWGTNETGVATSSSSDVNTLTKIYRTSVSNYKLDLGLQFTQPISKKDLLTLGVVVSPGHNTHADPECIITNKKSTTGKSDSLCYRLDNAIELAWTYGVGLAYQHGTSFRMGVDYQMQKWGDVVMPQFVDEGNGEGSYQLKTGLLKDMHRVNVGAEWLPNANSVKFFNRVRYRIGAGYATPYYYINNSDGPKEYHVSLGFGIPIMNNYNHRSILNISAEWNRRSAANLVKENTFRINIGLTFNERWFAKWKVD